VSAEHTIDVAALLPPKKRIVRHIVGMALLSLVGGPLVGLYAYNAPRGEALALSLGTGLGWGLSFAFVAVFIYTIWLIRYVTRGYHKQVAARRMEEFYRAVEGEPKD